MKDDLENMKLLDALCNPQLPGVKGAFAC